jgi:hypothetical protein
MPGFPRWSAGCIGTIRPRSAGVHLKTRKSTEAFTMETNVKTIIAVTFAIFAFSVDAALAQYGDTVPIRRNYLGQLACPSDYVIQDNYCISIYSRNFRGDYGGALPQRSRLGPVVQPWINQRGELQCPSDYVLDGANNCVSIYARRRYY